VIIAIMMKLSGAILIALSIVALSNGEPKPSGADFQNEMEDHWDQFLTRPMEQAANRQKRSTEPANDPKPDMEHHKTFDYIGHLIRAIKNKVECLEDVKEKWNISNFEPPHYQQGYFFRTIVKQDHHEEHHDVTTEKVVSDGSETEASETEAMTSTVKPKKVVYRYLRTKALITLPKACVWQCYAKKQHLTNENGNLDYEIIGHLLRPLGDSYVSHGRKVFDMCSNIVKEYPEYPFNIEFDTTHGARDGYTIESCVKTVKMVLCNSAMGRGFL